MIESAHAALHCVHRPAQDARWPGRVFVSVAPGAVAEGAGELVGRFLSEQLGEEFVETREGLAVEAFYDLLRSNFSQHSAAVVAFGPAQADGSTDESDAEWLEFLAAMRCVTWLFHGLARVRRNPARRILVRFGALPGAIEFAPAALALSPAGQTTTQSVTTDEEASICYGFGCADRDPVEVIEVLRGFARHHDHLATSIWRAEHV